jgi:hypothetical protein
VKNTFQSVAADEHSAVSVDDRLREKYQHFLLSAILFSGKNERVVQIFYNALRMFFEHL